MKRKFFSIKQLGLFLAMGVISTSVYANTVLQDVKVTVNHKNAPISRVLDDIEQQTGYSILVRNNDINIKQKVTVNVSGSLETVLADVFEGMGVQYNVENKTISVYRVKASSAITKSVNQNKKTVTGIIVDENGEPVIGANVVEKGTTNGTVTDIDGNFSINVSVNAILEVSYIGYKTQNVAYKGEVSLAVTLKEDSEKLDEVVVIGYGTKKKASLVGSVEAVKSDDIVKAPVANVSNALGGRLPGLISSQISGEPGLDNASINIRGFGNALVIVDGVESSMNNVSANEIADITILKDASAAIYGSRAGNGVVLVTTKRGSVGKPKIEFNGTFSWQQPTIYPDQLTAGEYTRFVYERDVRAKIDPSKYAYPLSEVEKWEAGATPDYKSTDWWDFLMRKFAPFQQYNLSTSGGSEKIKYYITYNHSNQGGILKSDAYKFKTNNFRSNIDAQVTDRLSITGDISAMISNIDTPPREHDWIWQDITNVLPTWHATLPDPNKIPYTGNVTSVVASTSDKGGYKKKDYFQFSGRLSASYKVPGIEGLVAKAMLDYHLNTNETKYFMKGYDMWKYSYANDSYIREGSAWQTRLNEGWSKSNQFTSNIGLYYDKKFNDHSISVMFLNEIVQSSGKNIGATGDGFINDDMDYLNGASDSSDDAYGAAWENGRVGYVGRVGYDFKSRYMLEATFRYDGSPVFAPGKRWGFFPSVSLAWRISDEPFIKSNSNVIDNLKIRAGVSKSGYDAIGNFQYVAGYYQGGSGCIDNQIVSGILPSGIANPDITWEESVLYNFGIDYGFWNDKLYGSIDVFYRYRDNILAYPTMTLPSTFGASLPMMNINSTSNRGFEFVIGHRSKIGEVKYDIKANVSFAREKYENYDEPEYTDPDEKRIKQKSGQWSDLIWGLETDGLFTSQEEIDSYPVILDSREGYGNSLVKPGQIKYVDQNGDNKIDWRDQVVIGRRANIRRVTPDDVHSGNSTSDIAAPEFMYGLDLNLSYKNFNFSALFQGGAGYSTWVWASNYLLYKEAWTEENNDPYALFPVQGPEGAAVTGGVSDYNLVNVWYLRLKNLNIGYTIPEKILWGVKLKLYLSGTNLLTFSNLNKYKMDPEAPDGGCYYPQQRVYTVGVNLTF